MKLNSHDFQGYVYVSYYHEFETVLSRIDSSRHSWIISPDQAETCDPPFLLITA